MAGISLVKGQKIDLTKGKTGLTHIIAGLGWDPVVARGFFGRKKQADIDCDASAILLDDQGRLTKESNLVCFHNKQSACRSVVHSGDNLTGEGEGDDEQIKINLTAVPADVHKILIVVNIYDCINRKQDFGMIERAYIRILDARGSEELVRFNLSESYAGKTALICGELYRHNGEWKFSAIGEGDHAVHIDELARRYT
ncbi:MULTISPECIES: TerD family protein [unclassified Paenibacillus]|uniref:TerD family protein n=1 Tax=unclassified Paenibacillus TaxID=185978 RepID=UPI001F3FEE21|nr:TerD family protein [Paenibacillus sp. JJ-223]CAH1224296.1 Stress response protein SCP2 [Paenibacillus sp. JJ-223]